jgi:hypothetical protein
MNALLGHGRALRRIERDLADSDPSLDALFLSFSATARGEKMPRVEKIRTGPLRLLARLGPSADENGAWRGGWWSCPTLHMRGPGELPPSWCR